MSSVSVVLRGDLSFCLRPLWISFLHWSSVRSNQFAAILVLCITWSTCCISENHFMLWHWLWRSTIYTGHFWPLYLSLMGSHQGDFGCASQKLLSKVLGFVFFYPFFSISPTELMVVIVQATLSKRITSQFFLTDEKQLQHNPFHRWHSKNCPSCSSEILYKTLLSKLATPMTNVCVCFPHT